MENHDNIMTTATGGYFNFSKPIESKINVVDIAHALSNVCRFAGHTREFYSVAEHSIMCYKYLVRKSQEADQTITPRTLMYALMHDAAEAFMSDIPKPCKVMIQGIEAIEDTILGCIFELLELDIDDVDVSLVKEADRFMLFKEAKELTSPSSRFRYVWGPQIAGNPAVANSAITDEDDNFVLECMGPGEAAGEFLEIFNRLRWKRV